MAIPIRVCKRDGCGNPVPVDGMLCGMCIMKDDKRRAEHEKQRRGEDRPEATYDIVMALIFVVFILAVILIFR